MILDFYSLFRFIFKFVCRMFFRYTTIQTTPFQPDHRIGFHSVYRYVFIWQRHIPPARLCGGILLIVNLYEHDKTLPSVASLNHSWTAVIVWGPPLWAVWQILRGCQRADRCRQLDETFLPSLALRTPPQNGSLIIKCQNSWPLLRFALFRVSDVVAGASPWRRDHYFVCRMYF